MKTLKYNDILRYEDNEDIISNLLRKGWVDATPPNIVRPELPEYNPDTERLLYNEDENSYYIIQLSEDEISDLRKVKQSAFLFQKINDGFLVEPEGFVLALSDADRSAFSQMLSLVKEALDLGLITNETPQIISDKDGQKHEITTLRFRQIMVQYGFYYKSLWDQLG